MSASSTIAEPFGAARRLVYPEMPSHEPEVAAWTLARVAGAPQPGWIRSGGAQQGAIAVQTLADARIWPRYGVVGDAEGRLSRASLGEVLTAGLTAADFPAGPPDERLGPAAVFMPFGGLANYGHFLLDALTSLQALDKAGLIAGRAVLAPPLRPWHRELLSIGFPELQVRETAARLVAADEAAWADSMDHYLHRPGPAVLEVRERLLARAPERRAFGPKVYLSRRGQARRVLLGEAELERALSRRGFAIVRPERLSPAEQISLARRAAVIVGASGAALANALFASPRARVVELMPEGFAHPWVRDLCLRVGCEWRGWFAEGRAGGLAALPRSLRRGFAFAWRLDVPAFLAWCDADGGL